jgi:hypothetical protein
LPPLFFQGSLLLPPGSFQAIFTLQSVDSIVYKV